MNEKNLIPFSERSVSEARESGAKGGKKSGETRRKKRDMKAKMKMLLELPCTADDWNEAAMMGIDASEIDNETAMLIGLFKEAKSGNVQAVKEIRNILGKDNSSEELALKKKEMKMKEEDANNSPEDTSLHITIDYGDENESESTG